MHHPTWHSFAAHKATVAVQGPSPFHQSRATDLPAQVYALFPRETYGLASCVWMTRSLSYATHQLRAQHTEPPEVITTTGGSGG
jgi:hypothetical protein